MSGGARCPLTAFLPFFFFFPVCLFIEFYIYLSIEVSFSRGISFCIATKSITGKQKGIYTCSFSRCFPSFLPWPYTCISAAQHSLCWKDGSGEWTPRNFWMSYFLQDICRRATHLTGSSRVTCLLIVTASRSWAAPRSLREAKPVTETPSCWLPPQGCSRGSAKLRRAPVCESQLRIW